MNIIDRFLKYVSIETTSDPSSNTCPSAEREFNLANLLVDEMKEMGLSDVSIDKYCYVYGRLPSNIDKDVPKVGFIAHMDTSPDASGKDVHPQFVKYEGGDIKLNDEYTMTVKEFPFLKDLVGQELITTDGTTLLGGDDKAGIAIILSAMEYLIKHPEIKHGDIMVGFTPDEEIGTGADLFDVEKFGADFAYTVDGGPLGELNFETFNAASANIKIEGKMVHPGSAKDILINSQLVGMELNAMLPANQRPEHTEKYEGFFMLASFKGDVVNTEMSYLVRDHNKAKFEAKKELITSAVNFLNQKYGNIVDLDLSDMYYNMREKIEPHMDIIDIAKKSMEDIGVTPEVKAIRGGTDGAKLSFKGLPCPNLFTGGYNFHGRYEFIPTESLKKGEELVVKIAENLAAK